MLAGEQVQDCAQCYETEASGGTSLRQVANESARWTFQAATDEEVLDRARAGAVGGSGSGECPSTLHLWLGNHCNLKCRMCSPMFSSRIAADPVHARWSGIEPPAAPDWSQNERVVFDEILGRPECLKYLQFSGGEPLIHPLFERMLQTLGDTGHASHIGLYIASNGTTYSPRVSSLLTTFAAVELAISVEGVGTLQEYIRHPSKWDTIERNVAAFRGDGVSVSIRPTAQSYNVFGLLPLMRWGRRAGLWVVLDNVLRAPRFLSLDVLPQAIIDEAFMEWEAYLDGECRDEDRWHVRTLMSALRRPRPRTEELAVLQDQFVRFTNDLDRSRGECLAMACPRLHERLVAAGLAGRGGRRVSA